MTNRRGNTMIEVLAAFAMITLVIFALATCFPTGLSSVRKSQNTLTATNLARQTLETWRNKDFKSILHPMIALPVTSVWPDPAHGALAPPGWDGVTYQIFTTVTDLPTPDPNVVQLDVQVIWNSGNWAGNKISTDAHGNAVAGFANSSVRCSTCVFNVVNPW